MLSPASVGVVSFLIVGINSAATPFVEAFRWKLLRGVVELRSSLWLSEAVEAVVLATIAGGAEVVNLQSWFFGWLGRRSASM